MFALTIFQWKINSNFQKALAMLTGIVFFPAQIQLWRLQTFIKYLLTYLKIVFRNNITRVGTPIDKFGLLQH